MHVHENIARNRFAQRKLEIVERLRALVREVFGEEWEVECNVWTEVKGYGPGVGHWVLDVEVLKKSVKKAVIVEGVKI